MTANNTSNTEHCGCTVKDCGRHIVQQDGVRTNTRHYSLDGRLVGNSTVDLREEVDRLTSEKSLAWAIADDLANSVRFFLGAIHEEDEVRAIEDMGTAARRWEDAHNQGDQA